jgi:RES domain-containing protein
MSVETLAGPWTGDTFRHIPAGARYDILDFSRAGAATLNRWNAAGDPTLYLAGDRGVAIAEFARHLTADRPPAISSGALERQIYRLRVHFDRVLDFCRVDVWGALSFRNAPRCFLDRSVARATAHFLRVTSSVQAIRVPSVTFLDDLDRWNLVVFLEKLPHDPGSFVLEVAHDDTFSIRP